jgi:glycosyltransferase involved in cell wall biosynthesis
MSERKNSVAHVLPGMNYGGVEVAISRSFKDLNKEFNYKIYYVKDRGEIDVGQSSILNLFKNIIQKSNYPNILLTSLWWGHIVGIFLYPFISLLNIKWVCFIHSTGYSSIFDKFATKLALTLCDNHIFDSESSRAYFNSYENYNNFVVPYIFINHEESKSFNHSPELSFSWVGRNSKEKRLDLLAKFINSMVDKDIPFLINICIAGDSHSCLDDLAVKHKNSVKIQYNVPPSEITSIYKNSKIALCFSDYEGFSASTAEAALYGNLIFARRVGELPNYLCNKSTIWLDDLDDKSWEAVVLKIKDYLGDEIKLSKLRLESKKYTSKILTNRDYTSSLSATLKKINDF